MTNQDENQYFNNDYDDKPSSSKQFFMIMIFLIVLLLLCFGVKWMAKNNDNVEIGEFNEVIENYNKVENYDYETKLRVESKGIVAISESKGTFDIKNKKGYEEIISEVILMQSKQTIYYDYDSLVGYYKYEDDKNWTKGKVKTRARQGTLGYLIEKLKKQGNIHRVEEGHYKIWISKEEAQELKGENDNNKTLYGEYIHIYIENGYIVKFEDEQPKETKSKEKITSIITYSNFNKAKEVVIPPEIIKNAVEEKSN